MRGSNVVHEWKGRNREFSPLDTYRVLKDGTLQVKSSDGKEWWGADHHPLACHLASELAKTIAVFMPNDGLSARCRTFEDVQKRVAEIAEIDEEPWRRAREEDSVIEDVLRMIADGNAGLEIHEDRKQNQALAYEVLKFRDEYHLERWYA